MDCGLNGIFLLFFTASPRLPFPWIGECGHIPDLEAKQPACRVTGSRLPTTLNCSVYQYYPNISLYFLHKSSQLVPVETKEHTNSDMTRNKFIIVDVPVSEDPYECVASGIPGFRTVHNRSVRIFVELPAERDGTAPVTDFEELALHYQVQVSSKDNNNLTHVLGKFIALIISLFDIICFCRRCRGVLVLVYFINFKER